MAEFYEFANKFGIPGMLIFAAWRVCVWCGPNVVTPLVDALKGYLTVSAAQQVLHSAKIDSLNQALTDTTRVTHDKIDTTHKLLTDIAVKLKDDNEEALEFRKSVESLLKDITPAAKV